MCPDGRLWAVVADVGKCLLEVEHQEDEVVGTSFTRRERGPLSNAAGLPLGFFPNRQWTFSRGFRPGAVSARFVFVGGADDPDCSTGVGAKWPGAVI